MSIRSLFYPRAVAIIGSVSKGKIGYELARQLLEGGYHSLYAVNPKSQGVFSIAGYDAIHKIGRPVDLAIIVSPAATVAQTLEECGEAGVQTAIIITAGFAEVGNVEAEEELKRTAARCGVRFVGPNCAGVVNTAHRLFATLETRPPAGGVAVVAQSGAIGGLMMAWAREYGLGISKFVSYGNGVDLDEVDFLRYLAADTGTKVVALYIESTADGRALMDAVRECARHKPVLVIKAGRTDAGQRAARSHTGALAGADAVYDAALRQCGALRLQRVEEMFDLCKAFVSLPPLTGRRVVIVTNSGGPGVLAADRAAELGLDVAEPGPSLREKLASFLPAHCALRNPIDLTVEGSEEGYRKTLAAALQEYDAALVLNIAPPYLDSVPLAWGICDAAERSHKPVVATFLPRPNVNQSIFYLEERGVPNFPSGERAAEVLAKLAERESLKPTLEEARPLPPISPATHLPTLEPEIIAWLRENGFPTLDFRYATGLDEAIAACQEIGYPVVMKVVAPDILHKSEYGGVILEITDDQLATDAFEVIRWSVINAEKDFQGVIIYPMVRRAQEALVGLSRDPQFGPVVAFGLGGIYAEVWRDVTLRVAPVSHAEAAAMIREIRAYPILAGARGRPPCDLEALADVIVRCSELPFRYPEIAELDLNPVFLLPKGVRIGDARLIRGTPWRRE